MNSYTENQVNVLGDPWSVLPIKTRKYAKDCTEIVLSDRGINNLVNFEFFENLEALWLNNNQLEKIEGLDKNFRLKLICLENNRLVTLDGSLNVMKFIQVLLLNDNKLRNLDKNISILKSFSFLKNLNLFGNPLAEEPEYRNRIIFALPSLDDLDRHKINPNERTKSAQVVKEFLDPLSKKRPKYIKKLKVYENFSLNEKELFREADQILNRNKMNEDKKKEKIVELLEKEKVPKGFIPKTNIIEKLDSVYFDKSVPDCFELDTNEIRRIFNTYDKTNLGFIKKNEIQYVFLDIKNILTKTIEINEKKFIDLMLDFYSKSKETCTISDIKKCFNNILHNYKNNSESKNKIIPDLIYLKNYAFHGENIEEIKQKEKEKLKLMSNGRNDIFYIKSIGKEYQVILNENKLQSIYK